MTQGRTTQHKQAKYPNISQPTLDKFQLQYYSKCSKWRPKFDHGRWYIRVFEPNLVKLKIDGWAYIYEAAARDSESGFMRRACPSVRLSVCLFVCQSVAKLQRLSNLELWCLLTTYRKSYVGFSKNPLLDP